MIYEYFTNSPYDWTTHELAACAEYRKNLETFKYKVIISQQISRIRNLREQVVELQRLLAGEFKNELIARISDHITRNIQMEIVRALVGQNLNDPSKIVTMRFEANDLKFLDRSSLERKILEKFVNKNVPNMSLSIDNVMKGDEAVRRYQIFISDLVYDYDEVINK